MDLYPLEKPAPTPADVYKRLNAQGDILNELGSAIGSALFDRLGTQQSNLDAIGSTLNRSISGRIGANTRKLGNVGDILQNTLINRISEQGATNSLLQLAVHPPVTVPHIPPVTGGLLDVYVDCVGHSPTMRTFTHGSVPTGTQLTYIGTAVDNATAVALFTQYTLSHPQLCLGTPNPIVPVSPPVSPPVTIPPNQGKGNYVWEACCPVGITTLTWDNPNPPAELYKDCALYFVGFFPYGIDYAPAIAQWKLDHADIVAACGASSVPPQPVSPPIGTPIPPTECPPVVTCPPVSEPPPITTEPPTALSCNLPKVLQQGFPFLGTKEFCIIADSLIAGFADIPQALLDVIDNTKQFLDLSSCWQVSDLGSLLNPAVAIISALQTLLSTALKNMPGCLGDDIRKLVACWQAFSRASIQCNPDAVLGAALVKTVLISLKNTRVGTDLAVWFTVDIQLLVDPAVEWIDALLRYACPQGYPSQGEAMELYYKGEITEAHLKCLLALHGLNWQLFTLVVHAGRTRISAQQFIELGYRLGIDQDTITLGLRSYGYLDLSDSQNAVTLFDQVPGLRETITWHQTSIDDAGFRQQFSLDTGFEDEFWPQYGNAIRAQGITKERAALNWASSWRFPNGNELAEMRFRLRPGRVSPDVQFSAIEYQQLLASQAIAPYFRQRLSAIAYRLPSIRFLRNQLATGTIDKQELAEQYQDLGYSPERAQSLAETDSVLVARQLASQTKGYTPATLSKLFALQLVGPDQVNSRMAAIGYTSEESQALQEVASLEFQTRIVQRAVGNATSKTISSVQAAYQSGAIDRNTAHAGLSSLGFPDQLIGASLDAVDLTRKTGITKRATAILGKAVRDGKITPTQAATQLQGMGVSFDVANDQANLWTLEQSVLHKELTADKILTLVAKGILPVAIGAERLRNIGYEDADTLVLLSEAQQRLLTTEAKALQVQNKTRAQQAASIEKALADNKKQEKRLQQDLCRQYPIPKLIRWYADHWIGENYITEKMTLCGYATDVIQNTILEAMLARETLSKKRTSAIEQVEIATGAGVNGSS